MIDEFEEREKLEATAKKEAKRLQKLFKEVFDNDEGQEVLEILMNHFDVDVPSAVVATFDTNKMLYLDGQKSVFKEIADILAGKYNE